MLVAHFEGTPVEAGLVEKGSVFVCPGCRETVILKKGHIVVHHFAHYPGSRCEFGTGETLAHLKAKHDMAQSRGGGLNLFLRPRNTSPILEQPILKMGPANSSR